MTWQRECMHALQAAKTVLEDHEEQNQNNLKYFVQIVPPCFCLGVKIPTLELMYSESLTSFRVSFIWYHPGPLADSR